MKKTSHRYDGARDIEKVIQFESRLRRTLDNGVSTGFHSPESSPDKHIKGSSYSVERKQGQYRPGLESGYLRGFHNLHSIGGCYESDSEDVKSSTVRRRRTPVLKRSNSLVTLSPVPEENDSVFLTPHVVTENPYNDPQDSARGRKPDKSSKKIRFLDVRNLRLSFRKKSSAGKSSAEGSHWFTPRLFSKPQGSGVMQKPTSLSYQNSNYFESPAGTCVECSKLLKDPRYCEHALLERQPSNLIGKSNKARYINQNTQAAATDQHQAYLRGVQMYGSVKRRERYPPAENDVIEDMRDSLARFSVTSSYLESLPNHSSRNSKLTNCYPQLPRPPESQVVLVKNFKLSFLQNKWISDITVTKKGDFAVTDTKQAYIVDKEGNLKSLIGVKASCKLHTPNSVATDNMGNLVISDPSSQKIQIYNSKGQHLRTLEDPVLSHISRVDCNEQGQVLGTSADKRQIVVFSQDNKDMLSIRGQMQTYPDSHRFYRPFSIAVNKLTADLIIGDDYKQSVIALSPFGKPKWNFAPSCNKNKNFFPNSICTDNNGYIFVADVYNEKVYMLDPSGKYLKTLLSTQSGLNGGPVAIATDAQGHLLVSDEERTLKVFKYGERDFALYRRVSLCHNNL